MKERTLRRLARRLTRACESRRQLGWRITVVSSLEDPCCCPLGACMDPSRPSDCVGDPFYQHPTCDDAAECLRLPAIVSSSFICGFDSEACVTNGDVTAHELGMRFRRWYFELDKEVAA